MKSIIVISVLFFISSCSSSKKMDAHQEHPLSIVQGVTTHYETVISVLAPTDANLNFFYKEMGAKPKTIVPYFEEISPDQKKKIMKFHIIGLGLNKSYSFIAKNAKTQEVYDERKFRALNLKLEKPKIGIASCLDDASDNIYEIWSAYLNEKTDINFLIGDNSYADKINGKWGIEANKKQLWKRYAETWEKLHFYHSPSLTPTLYLWDDHDYGLNNGGSEFRFKKDALEVFRAFYPQKEIKGVLKFTHGAGSVFKAFNQTFVFIDARYFRSRPKASKNQTQWGRSQENEIFNILNASKFTWLIQGDQYFGAYHTFESYERDRPESFLKILSQIKKRKSKVLFVSGDRHLTEIMKIDKKILGYETFELTSSGMHAKVFPGAYERHPNPNLLSGKSGVLNFMIVEPVISKSRADLKVISKGLKGKVHFEENLAIGL